MVGWVGVSGVRFGSVIVGTGTPPCHEVVVVREPAWLLESYGCGFVDLGGLTLRFAYTRLGGEREVTAQLGGTRRIEFVAELLVRDEAPQRLAQYPTARPPQLRGESIGRREIFRGDGDGDLDGFGHTESYHRAGQLAGAHRDPFNRLIAAQALSIEALVVTNDSAFPALGVAVVW